MKTVTEKQTSYIRRLTATRQLPNEDPRTKWVAEFTVHATIDEGDTRGYPAHVASKAIDWLLTLPEIDPANADEALADGPTVEPGIYQVPNVGIVKVQANKAGTRMYAKRWVDHGGDRVTEDGGTAHGDWEYAPGAIRDVAPEHRMTLDEAKAFATVYGHCVRCGRTLKAAESVEAGIGPVCAGYFA